MMASRPWWRPLVDDRWVEQFRLFGVAAVWVGRNPCRLVQRGDASRVPVPHYLRVPRETLGLVRAAAAASSFSLLKVLFGMRRFRLQGAWCYFCRGRSGCKLFSCSLLSRGRHLLLFFLCFFLFGFGCAALPASLLYLRFYK
jgi:hypothetical protein